MLHVCIFCEPHILLLHKINLSSWNKNGSTSLAPLEPTRIVSFLLLHYGRVYESLSENR